LKTRRLL